MSSSRDMAVANFMPQCADFVFICVLTGFLQTAITPAGQFEDTAVVPGLTGSPVKMSTMDGNLTQPRGRC